MFARLKEAAATIGSGENFARSQLVCPCTLLFDKGIERFEVSQHQSHNQDMNQAFQSSLSIELTVHRLTTRVTCVGSLHILWFKLLPTLALLQVCWKTPLNWTLPSGVQRKTCQLLPRAQLTLVNKQAMQMLWLAAVNQAELDQVLCLHGRYMSLT